MMRFSNNYLIKKEFVSAPEQLLVYPRPKLQDSTNHREQQLDEAPSDTDKLKNL